MSKGTLREMNQWAECREDGQKCRVNIIYHLAPQFIIVLPVYISLVLILHNYSPNNVLFLL